MYRRGPAIRHKHRVTVDDIRAFVGPHDPDPPPSTRASDPGAKMDRNSRDARHVKQSPIDLVPLIEDRNDRRPSRGKVERDKPGAVVRRGHDDAGAGYDTVTMQ